MGCCGQITRGPAGPAGPTSAEVVFSQSDLPSASGGVITLDTDTTYWIAEEVTIEDGVAIQLQEGSCLIGNGKYCSRLIGNVDGAAFVRGPASLDLNIESLGVENQGTGEVISHNGGGTADTHLLSVLVDGSGTAAAGLLMTAVSYANLHNCDFVNVTGGNGVSVAGAGDVVDVEDSLFDANDTGLSSIAASSLNRLRIDSCQFDNNATAAVSLDGTIGDFQTNGGAFDLPAAGVGIAFLAAVTVTNAEIGDNAFIMAAGAISLITFAGATVSDASVSGNVVRGAGGTVLGGTLTSQTDGWLFGDNVGIEDTAFIGELSFYSASPGLSVTGGAAPAGDIADTAAVQAAIAAGDLANFQADGVTGAKLEYIGNKDGLFKITASLTGAITAGGAIRVLQLMVNDVAVGRAVEVFLGNTTQPAQMYVSHTVRLNPGDIVSANVSADVTEMSSYHLTAVAAE